MRLQPYYTPFKMIFQGIVTAELTFASTKACLRQKGGLGGLCVGWPTPADCSFASEGWARASEASASKLMTWARLIHRIYTGYPQTYTQGLIHRIPTTFFK